MLERARPIMPSRDPEATASLHGAIGLESPRAGRDI